MKKTPEEKPEEMGTEKNSEAQTQSRESVPLADGAGGILGVKAGMTQIYAENGDAIAVTVIDLRPNVVTQVKTKAKDG